MARDFPLIDQYGDAIPDDLVVIPELTVDEDTYLTWFLTLNAAAKRKESASLDRNQKLVNKAKWYEFGSIILVSAQQVDPLVGDPLEDFGIILTPESTLMLIDQPLKRWSIRDGFYHA